jgi:hypothetical protein
MRSKLTEYQRIAFDSETDFHFTTRRELTMSERTMQERARCPADVIRILAKEFPSRDIERDVRMLELIGQCIEAEAAAARDDGKRALTWTREKPTEPGWYWVKLDVPDGKIDVRYFRGSWDAVYYVPVLFAGPIPEPAPAGPR